MDAVLEHISDVGKVFSEVSRVLIKKMVYLLVMLLLWNVFKKYHTIICHLKQLNIIPK
jgi:hypothetical protein